MKAEEHLRLKTADAILRTVLKLQNPSLKCSYWEDIWSYSPPGCRKVVLLDGMATEPWFRENLPATMPPLDLQFLPSQVNHARVVIP
jgi:hypothetical protein